MGDRPAGDAQIPGQTPGVERCLCPWCAELLVKGLHRTAAFSVHLVPVHQFVQFDIEFHLLTHTVEVGHLSRHNPRRKIGEKEAVAFRGLRSTEVEKQDVLSLANMHIGVNSLSVEHESLVVEERIEGSPRGQRPGELSPGKIVDFGLPAVFEADDYADALSLTSLEGVRHFDLSMIGSGYGP